MDRDLKVAEIALTEKTEKGIYIKLVFETESGNKKESVIELTELLLILMRNIREININQEVQLELFECLSEYLIGDNFKDKIDETMDLRVERIQRENQILRDKLSC